MIKTHRIRLPDGQCEIVRILTSEDLETWSADVPLAYEKSIVWLVDIEKLPYVRTVEVRCARSRRGKLRLNSGERVVGYAKLLANAPRDPETMRYTRRLFYLKDADHQTTGGPTPENVIDPNTVLPGVAGEHPKTTPPQLSC